MEIDDRLLFRFSQSQLDDMVSVDPNQIKYLNFHLNNSYYFQEPLLYRVLGVIVISSLGLFILTTTQEGKEALKTVIDSRTEIRRVVWPTRTETTQTPLIVLVAITIAALILWGLDSLFGWATAALLG